METRDAKLLQLTEATVRICPACGVVNPSGSSGGCPHLQLVRFEGVPEELETTLAAVAVARRRYSELVTQLKKSVMDAVSTGDGQVETPRKIMASQADALYHGAGRAGPFVLSPVEAPRPPADKNRPAKKRAHPQRVPPVDSRQLDLLALSTPKGDA